MLPYVVIQKKRGETPLEALIKWKETHPEYRDVSATYAGRLDPMAEGALLVLLGDECKQQKKYHGLDKTYEIEVLLDISTDTGDVLGLPTFSDISSHPTRKEVRDALKKEVGTHTVPYPAFSSKPVAGKPLFQYALEGTLNTIDVPTHTEHIYTIKLLRVDTVSKESLQKHIQDSLALAPTSNDPRKTLGADFRQETIRTAWETAFTHTPSRTYTVLTLRVTAGSGTYMRTLAERISKSLGTCGMALSIKRTLIGRFVALFGGGFWRKKFC